MKRWIFLLLLWGLPLGTSLAADPITCWFVPGWKDMPQAKAIAGALGFLISFVWVIAAEWLRSLGEPDKETTDS